MDVLDGNGSNKTFVNSLSCLNHTADEMCPPAGAAQIRCGLSYMRQHCDEKHHHRQTGVFLILSSWLHLKLASSPTSCMRGFVYAQCPGVPVLCFCSVGRFLLDNSSPRLELFNERMTPCVAATTATS